VRYQLRVKGVPRRRLSTWFDGRQVISAVNGQATAPMFAWVDLPPLASVVSVLVVPLLAELADRSPIWAIKPTATGAPVRR
jgi:hypothetical protein